MSIGRRLAVGFGLVFGLLVFVIAIFIYNEQQQSEAMAYLTERIMPRAAAANDLETAYLFQSSGARSYLLSGQESWLGDYRKGVSLAADAISRLDNLPKTPEGNALFDQIRPLASRFNQAADRAIALRQQGRVDEATMILTQEMAPARDSLIEKTDAFVALQDRLSDETKASLDQLRQDNSRNGLVGAVFSLLVAVGIAYWTARSIRRPTRALIDASARLAAGDYASAIDGADQIAGNSREPTSDELRQLAGGFGTAARGLQAREHRLSAEATLSGLLASTIDVHMLAGQALREMATCVGAEMGLVYLLDTDPDLLRRSESFCADFSTPDIIALGDGVVGEAAASRHTVLVKDIPSDLPFKIDLGVDRLSPRWVAALPMLGRDELVGVLLLAGIRGLDKLALEYLEQGVRQLAVSLQNGLAHERIEVLVEDLQEKNEELQVQSEELQVQSEEISTQNDELRALSETIQFQNEELSAQNEELQSQNEELHAQGEELTEQNELIARQAERLSRLQAITVSMSESLEPQQVMDHVVRAATDLTGSALASVLLVDESGDYFTVASAVGLDEEQKATLRLGRHESLAGQVMESERTLFIEDVTKSPEVRFPRLAGGSDVGSLIVAPMAVAGEHIGVVEVYYDTPKTFSSDDVQLMSALGAAAAVAAYNSRLFLQTVQQKEKVEESVRERDEFISVAAHELKTPVTSLRGFAQLVQRDLEKRGAVDSERLSRAMERIDQQSKRLSRLTEQLLNLSRLQTGKMALSRVEADIPELVERVVVEMRQSIPSRVLDLRNSSPISAVLDPIRVEQVLVNLLDNAIKFSPESSPVQVEVDSDEPGWARISVRDWGIGIPRDKLHRVFERFFQAHPERHYGGMGIGLSLSHQIVEMHGGTITVEQPEDGGSRFVVRLPLARDGNFPVLE